MKSGTFEFGKALYQVDEVITANGGILPVSKSELYKLIKKGEIPSKSIGRRVFILGFYFDDIKKKEG